MTEREQALLAFNAWEGFHARFVEEWSGRGMSPEEVLAAGSAHWEEMGLPEKCRGFLERIREKGWQKREANRADRLGVRLVFWGNPDYPCKLTDLSRPPVVLYAKGAWPPPARVDGIVGTRRSSPYGTRMAREIAFRLGKEDVGVLSGGALGIDGAAHGGAIEAGGMTLAVLGTGVDLCYPPEHESLFPRIAENGTLLSEFPLSTPGRSWRFPKRNRLIAALADRLVVVEAPAKSGAIVTAKLAMEIGREVWVVPGRADEWVCKGSNRLLWDGAQPLVEIDDLVRFPGAAQAELFRPGGGNSSNVLEALRVFGDQTVDILASQVKMSAADVLVELSRLEAFGMVRRSLSGRWSALPGQSVGESGYPIR